MIVRLPSSSAWIVRPHIVSWNGPWAAYFGLTWESGDPVHIGTAVGGFQAYLHVVGMQIDRFTWETPVAIAGSESLPELCPGRYSG